MTYDPVAGTGYTPDEAGACWAAAMDRARHEGPKWSVRGPRPAEFYWSWSDFRHWTGRLTVEADGFHWSTHASPGGQLIHHGVTTSLYEAYQSVTRNEAVRAGRQARESR
jgi:hypothetical protein